jgi:hypothetical protein
MKALSLSEVKAFFTILRFRFGNDQNRPSLLLGSFTTGVRQIEARAAASGGTIFVGFVFRVSDSLQAIDSRLLIGLNR